MRKIDVKILKLSVLSSAIVRNFVVVLTLGLWYILHIPSVASRSIFDRLRVFFLPFPAPSPIKKVGFQPLTFFLTTFLLPH